MSRSSGYFITIDGPSGAGKTTISGLLATTLAGRGLCVTQTTQPSSSRIGELARYGTYEYHGITLSLLIAADRYHHTDTVISPKLDSGHVVVCDRYIPSSLVLDRLDGVEPEFVHYIYQRLPWPDLAVFLVADPVVSRARAAARGNHSRLQKTDLDGSRAESSLFKSVAGELAERGYPVFSMDVDERPASEIALRIANQVLTCVAAGGSRIAPAQS
jgi:dTMP kinase